MAASSELLSSSLLLTRLIFLLLVSLSDSSDEDDLVDWRLNGSVASPLFEGADTNPSDSVASVDCRWNLARYSCLRSSEGALWGSSFIALSDSFSIDCFRAKTSGDVSLPSSELI